MMTIQNNYDILMFPYAKAVQLTASIQSFKHDCVPLTNIIKMNDVKILKMTIMQLGVTER